MPRFAHLAVLIALLGSVLGMPALAEKKTVCTITVNSADEKDTFRERLPKGQYDFLELVEKGRPDWLRSACQKKVQCDVLVVSGHFNAGDTFYSDQLDKNEFLEIDELERASCSQSCPGVFAKLKEVYLFGCESLNPEPSFNGTGESGRERMRRIFANVPVIYGFSSSAPVGPTAAMLLNRYFDRGARTEFASGRTNAGLLKVFGRNSMVNVSGVRDAEPLAAERQRICRFFDERMSVAGKLAFVHRMLRGGVEAQTHFSRIEKLFASFTDAERQSGAFTQALAEISADDEARGRYLATMRRHAQPATRARMTALGGTLGWLSDEQQRGETIAMINDMLAGSTMGFAEVDLVCALNKDHGLDPELHRVLLPASRAGNTTQAAAMACLGSSQAHGQMLRALASADERDVQIAQVYLRHRPIARKEELRSVARDITRMPGAGPAQVRALDTLGRLHIADREIFDDLSRAFAEAKSVNVQRAIAEVFIRSDSKSFSKAALAGIIREHRLRAPGGSSDLIDVLIARLQSTS